MNAIEQWEGHEYAGRHSEVNWQSVEYLRRKPRDSTQPTLITQCHLTLCQHIWSSKR